MDAIEQECMKILQNERINPISSIDFNVNGTVHSLTFKYIIDTYMQASEESRLVFFNGFKKSSRCKRDGN